MQTFVECRFENYELALRTIAAYEHMLAKPHFPILKKIRARDFLKNRDIEESEDILAGPHLPF